DAEFKNKPIISFNTSESKPGKQIAINIEAKPKSSVAILGYDQRTFLLKSGNDIEKSTVISAVNKLVGCDGSEDFGSCASSSNHHYHYGYYSSRNNFRESGLIHFTNIRYPIPRYYEKVLYTAPRIVGGSDKVRDEIVPLSMAAARPAMKNADHDAEEDDAKDATPHREQKMIAIKPKSVRIREDFPETWLFEVIALKYNNLTITDTGKSKIVRKIPDSITSWFISSFAINKLDGFGLADTKAMLRVFRPFFVRLSLPYSVIRGETVAIPVTVY
ncbi:CD109 antigen-like isoform X2, partial [Leptotrombidium deliense]